MGFLKIFNLRNTSKLSEKWDSRYYSVMGLLCWTLGLSNIWAFPLLMSMDKGTYLLPCILSTIFISIPLTYMEMAIGQFSSSDSVGIWNMCLFWQGSGYACIFLLSCLTLYFSTIGSYLLYYLYQCFNTVLPWTECNPEWAKENCFTYATNVSIKSACYANHTEEYCDDLRWENSAAHYWIRRVSQALASGDLGNLRWEIIECHIVSLIITIFCLRNGLKSLQKYLTFFIVVPFIEQVILLFASLIHPGSIRGFDFFINQNFFKLPELKTWQMPIAQVLCSMGVGLGGLVIHGTLNDFRHPIHVDAIVINIVDLCYSIMFGFLSFTSLGILSYTVEMPVEFISSLEHSLLFIQFPQSLFYYPGIPQLWSFLFFSSAYLSALRSQIFMIAVIVSTLCSTFTNLRPYYTLSVAMVCLLISVLSLPFYSQFGPIILDFFHDMCNGPVILLVVFFEVFGVMWLYGMNNFVDDLHFMLGFRASSYWQFCWIICPFLTFTYFIVSTHYSSISPSSPYFMYFKSITISQYIIYLTPIVIVVIFALRYSFQSKNTKCSKLLRPSPKWGPIDPILYKSRGMFSSHSMTKEYIYRQNRVKSHRFQPEIPVILEDESNSITNSSD